MLRIPLITLLPALTLSALAAADVQDKPLTPAEQFAALRKEYDIATGSGVPLTDAERLKFVGRVYMHHFVVARKFLELAEKYPTDPVALDALIQAVWQVNGTPWPVELVGEDAARPRAFELLQRDHSRSDKLGPLCVRISYGYCQEYEPFLRSVLSNNPHKDVQATACLSLARHLSNRLQCVDLCRQQPELAREFAGLFGQEYLKDLLSGDHEKLTREIESVYEQAAGFAGARLPGGDAVADRAKAELFAIRHLSVGKDAPDIEGEDQDGRPFKLSDYRGRVVVLDFWSYV